MVKQFFLIVYLFLYFGAGVVFNRHKTFAIKYDNNLSLYPFIYWSIAMLPLPCTQNYARKVIKYISWIIICIVRFRITISLCLWSERDYDTIQRLQHNTETMTQNRDYDTIQRLRHRHLFNCDVILRTFATIFRHLFIFHVHFYHN